MSTSLQEERLMRYDAGKRAAWLAYVLWFFLGWFGVHRFYLGRWVSGFLMLALNGISWVLHFVLIGFLGFAVLGLWWLIDALLIPSMTRSYNERLIDRIVRR
ncbi:MAG: TM2 domain-containing protein [Geminicoccaceae bacterium]